MGLSMNYVDLLQNTWCLNDGSAISRRVFANLHNVLFIDSLSDISILFDKRIQHGNIAIKADLTSCLSLSWPSVFNITISIILIQQYITIQWQRNRTMITKFIKSMDWKHVYICKITFSCQYIVNDRRPLSRSRGKRTVTKIMSQTTVNYTKTRGFA